MQAGTLIDISPVLVFPQEEYTQHGSKTQLDCYTFKWGRTGEMALALGLGEHSGIGLSTFFTFRS